MKENLFQSHEKNNKNVSERGDCIKTLWREEKKVMWTVNVTLDSSTSLVSP